MDNSQKEIVARKAIQKAFSGITEDEANVLLNSGSFTDWDVGGKLTVEGELEFVFFVLVQGKVAVTKQLNVTEERLLNTLSPGAFFGEMSIIDDAPRAATITALSPVSVLEISREAFLSALHHSPVISLAMVREVTNRLRDNDNMAINDLRQKADELEIAYQQLADLEQARREFLTTIAHELRTPLTSAAGFMQLIGSGMMEGEALTNAVGTVSGNLQRIVSLTNDILFLQEMDLIFDEFKPVDILHMLTTIVDAERAHAKEMGVEVNLNMVSRLPDILGDVQSLERSFGAIINNAIKFSINGGNVDIYVSQSSDSLVISVRDQGLGIKEEDYENIFKRFWRTEEYNGRLFAGVGLGLPIAKEVIEQHDGRIEVSSEYESWTIFEIHLKLSKSAII